MTCLELFERLDAYRAGTVSPEDAALVEQHLLTCDACRADFHFQKTLRAKLDALPRSVEPGRNLWTGIQGKIGARRLAWWQRKGWLAAAALILVTLTSAVTVMLTRGERSEAQVAGSEEITSTEAEYREAAQELAQTLELSKREMSPAALAVVEQNLRIIDEAIRETQAALAADPRNGEVAALLWASYEKKIDLLERAAKHAES